MSNSRNALKKFMQTTILADGSSFRSACVQNKNQPRVLLIKVDNRQRQIAAAQAAKEKAEQAAARRAAKVATPTSSSSSS